MKALKFILICLLLYLSAFALQYNLETSKVDATIAYWSGSEINTDTGYWAGQDWSNLGYWAEQAVAAGVTCTSYEEQNTGLDSTAIGTTTANDWQKGTIYVAPANIDVCQVCVLMTANGDPAGQSYTYTAEIFTLSGSNLDASQGESSAINANNSWDDTSVCFEFGTSVSLSSGTSYGITIHRDDGGGGDSSNYCWLNYTQSDESPFDHSNEDFCRWQSGGTLGSRFDGWDIRMQIYTDQ